MEAGGPQKARVARSLAAVKTGELDPSLAWLDSTGVRAHQHAAGAPKERQTRPSDAVGAVRGTKIHPLAINERQVFGLILSGGQAGDAPVGEERLAQALTREEVEAVGADNSDSIRAMIAQANEEAVIPPRFNRINPPDYDREKYKERH